MSNTIKNIEKMSRKELARELRLWANTYGDVVNNYDAVLLLKCAKILDSLSTNER